MEAQGRPWQWPAKQEPTEAPPERRGRNSRLHGGKEVNGVLLLLGDGTQVPVTELAGAGPWTFLVLLPDPGAPDPTPADPGPVAAGAGFLVRFGRVVVPDLRGRPGWGVPVGGPGFLDLADDLDQVRTRAGLGRPLLVGRGDLATVALRAAMDQPWAWRALLLDPPAGPGAAGLDRLDLPVLVLAADPASAAATAALEGLLARLGVGPGWAGIAPDAPPR
jgi:pimeloyl-ACP methyl ester carboxylesterase